MCKVMKCQSDHDTHFCRYCRNDDSDHFSSRCEKAPPYQKNRKLRCHVSNCYQRHDKHYCTVCHNKNSDHLARQCLKGKKMFHGTKKQFARAILKDGWKASEGGRMGKGVYFTPQLDVATKAARRWGVKQKGCTQFAVLQCILDETNENVVEGKHPPWHKVSDSQFIEYVVREGYIKRIKIIEIHDV